MINYVTDEMIGSFVEGHASQNVAVAIIDRMDIDENLCEVLSLCFGIHAVYGDNLMN